MTKSEMIRVARGFATAPRGKEHFDGAAVFAAKVIQISDVVVGLVAQERHAVPLAQFASFLVTIEGPGKVIRVDQAHGHVVQRNGDSLPIPMFGQRLEGSLVVRQGLLESVLTMKDIAHVVLKPADTQGFAETREDFPRALRGLEGAVILAKQNEGLDGAAQCASCFLPGTQ